MKGLLMAEENYDNLYNCDVIESDGTKIGGVGQVYLDDTTGVPTWVTVKTGMFGTKELFVPLEDASFEDRKIIVTYRADFIKNAPAIAPDRHLSIREETKLCRYYGIKIAPTQESDQSAN